MILGAEVVVDYTRQHFEDELREYDGAFDLMGGDTLARSFGVVKRGELVVSIAGLPEPEIAPRTSAAVRVWRRCSDW